MITWIYANKFGELPSGQAEIVEALVQIAEQLDRLNQQLESEENAKIWQVKD